MDTAGLEPTPATLDAIRGRLLAWWPAHRRPLPFRADRNPYRVLVAEFMLQQTRATAALPFLERFLARFPDVAALAAASEQEVLALWQGLGYYRRAIHLLAAARRMRAAHGGEVPADPAALRALPGVGPYIAGAVGAFAFGRHEAACDANAVRVLCRLFDRDRADLRLATLVLPPGRAADWNEAVMDLGSAVCLPRRPRCGACPLAEVCAGRAAGRAADLPVRPVRRPRPRSAVTALVLRDADGRFALVQRPGRGLLAGLWEVPSSEAGEGPEDVARAHGVALAGPPVALPPFRHVFTHRAWDVQPFAAVGGPALPAQGPRGVRWVAPDGLTAFGLTGPSARLVAGAFGARAK